MTKRIRAWVRKGFVNRAIHQTLGGCLQLVPAIVKHLHPQAHIALPHFRHRGRMLHDAHAPVRGEAVFRLAERDYADTAGEADRTQRYFGDGQHDGGILSNVEALHPEIAAGETCGRGRLPYSRCRCEYLARHR